MSDISNFVQRGTDVMLGELKVSHVSRALHAADHFLQLRSASLTKETSFSGTGARRRVLGLPPLGEVVPCSPLAAGFSR